MPLRLLLYVARIYEKLEAKDSVYYHRLIPIPRPDFLVLYNGTAPYPDEATLALSEAFMDKPNQVGSLGSSLELTVKVLNINYGHNAEIMAKSETLAGYAYLINKCRQYIDAGMELTVALTQAIRDCIDEGILAKYLSQHASEVHNMLTTEWNLEDALRVRAQEGELTMLKKLFVSKRISSEAAYQSLLEIRDQVEASTILAEWTKEIAP